MKSCIIRLYRRLRLYYTILRGKRHVYKEGMRGGYLICNNREYQGLSKSIFHKKGKIFGLHVLCDNFVEVGKLYIIESPMRQIESINNRLNDMIRKRGDE